MANYAFFGAESGGSCRTMPSFDIGTQTQEGRTKFGAIGPTAAAAVVHNNTPNEGCAKQPEYSHSSSMKGSVILSNTHPCRFH